MADFDEEKMEALYGQKKVLIEDFRWEQDGQSNRYTGRAKAKTVEGDEILTVHGEKWGPMPKYSFVLRYQNTAIRVFDINDHHEGIDGGHKHMYKGMPYGDNEPYPVNDVSTSDVNQALMDFLDECEIEPGDVNIDQIADLNNYDRL